MTGSQSTKRRGERRVVQRLLPYKHYRFALARQSAATRLPVITSIHGAP
jgi:hypothetical protein